MRVLQIEKSLDQHWTEEQVNHLRETGLDIAHIAFVLNYMTIQKLLNRIEKYAGCAYETNCGRAVANIRNTAIIYIDYLMMRERRGYDLHNTVYQQPRDLSAAHRQMVTETNREEVKNGWKKQKKDMRISRSGTGACEKNIVTRTQRISSGRLDQQRKS